MNNEIVKVEKTPSINKRVIYYDILNILACMAVIFLHCNGEVHSFSNTRLWKECLVIEVICYFAVPILSILTEKKEYRKIMWSIVIFIFIFQSVLKPICTMLHIQFPKILNYMVGQNSYIIYLLLGYLLSTTKLNEKHKIVTYIMAIMALFIRYLHTLLVSVNTGVLSKDSWGYTAFTGLFPTIALFVFIKDFDWEKIFNKLKINTKIVSGLAGCSFGVYLIHMLMKRNIVKLLSINTTSYFYRLIFPLILYVICVIIVFIIKKIPIIKKVVP